MAKLSLLLSVFLGVVLAAAADDTLTALNLATEVQFGPPGAWQTDSNINAACISSAPLPSIVDFFTTTVNATVQFEFIGDMFSVAGMRTSLQTGVVEMAMDGFGPYPVAVNGTIGCSPYISETTSYGTHQVTLTFAPFEGVTQGVPELHVSNIFFRTPQAAGTPVISSSADVGAVTSATIEESSTAAPSAASVELPSSKSKTSAGVIAAATVCSVVGAIVLVGALYLVLRRRKNTRNRQVSAGTGNINLTELSPRVDTTPYPDEKVPPSMLMQGYDTKRLSMGSLGSMPPTYNLAVSTGLRARSRSPAP